MLNDPIIHYPFNIEVPIAGKVWTFTGFGLAVFGAFLIAQVISERELRRRGHEREALAVGDVLLAAIAGTLIGAKLYYVVVITKNWSDLFTRGGFVFWGGFIASVAACYLVIRIKKLSFARYADVGGIAIAAGYSVGRTGCWAVGDDYGRWYTGPLAVAFPEGAPPTTVGVMSREFGTTFPEGMDPGTVVSVIPTQLIETVLGFLMFAVLWRLRDHSYREGWLFGAYCVLAGVERFLIEFLRAKDDRFFGTFSMAQMIAVGVTVAGVAIMVERARSGGAGSAFGLKPGPAASSTG